LAEAGFVEGRDFDVELRAADYRAERLQELAADLVARNVAVIVALTTPSTVAARAETKSIPIVFFTEADPVASGFVSSFNHPGGNTTGIFALGPTLGTKWLELLHECKCHRDPDQFEESRCRSRTRPRAPTMRNAMRCAESSQTSER
jgi:putative ABC transport system substrate-binding protein